MNPEEMQEFLLEEEKNEDGIDLTGSDFENDNSEEDHVSLSENDTASHANVSSNTYADPNYCKSPGTVDYFFNFIPAAPGHNFDPPNINQTIEDIVRGAGVLQDLEEPVLQDFVGKDKVTVWKKTPIVPANSCARPVNIIRHLPGPKNEGKNVKTPLECSSLMIDNEILNIIVTNTKVFIESKSLKRSKDGNVLTN